MGDEMKMKFTLLALPLIILAMPSTAQDLRAGWEAAMAGDHGTALSNWKPLAESGDAQAQFQLGLMYRMGTAPIEQDNQAALNWFQLSAKQGFGPAQLYLGTMYFFGQGVPQDYETAHMWTNISIATEWESAFHDSEELDGLKAGQSRLRDSIERLMTPETIANAQQRARDCVTSNFANCD